MLTFHEVCETWLACRAVCKEFQKATDWLWFEVCRVFAENRIKRLIFIPRHELHLLEDGPDPGTSLPSRSEAEQIRRMSQFRPSRRPATYEKTWPGASR